MDEVPSGNVHLLLDVRVPVDEAEIASDFLWRHGAQAVEETLEADGAVRLSTDFGEDPLGAWTSALRSEPALTEISTKWSITVRGVDASVSDTWRLFVDDMVIADVTVRPAWKRAANDVAPQGALEVLVDPGGAFGMGDHPTTRGTLTLARALVGSTHVARILDLGCGSGVLAIALVKDTNARATAVDIARPAIEATISNAAMNGVANRIDTLLGDVRTVHGSFDLVLANILAPVLLVDAREIVERIAPGGHVILSGFTDTRRQDIIDAYGDLGCVLVDEVRIDGWWALQMQRRHERLEIE